MKMEDLIFTCTKECWVKHNVIYRFRNEDKKLAYVGLTTQSMRNRVRAHVNCPGNSLFDKTISMSTDIWYVDFLGQYNDVEELIQKEFEFYYVSKEHYNMIQNEKCLGHLTSHGRRYWVYDLKRKIEYTNLLCSEVHSLGINNINKFLRGELKSENGFVVLDMKQESLIRETREQIENNTYLYGYAITVQKLSNPVWAINIKTKEELIFSSQVDAAKSLQVPLQNLNKVLEQQRKTVGGFVVIRLKDKERIEKTKKDVLNNTFVHGIDARVQKRIVKQDLVWCINLENGHEEEDRCITHLARRLSIKSVCNIHKVLRGERNHCGGYVFLRNPTDEDKNRLRQSILNKNFIK